MKTHNMPRNQYSSSRRSLPPWPARYEPSNSISMARSSSQSRWDNNSGCARKSRRSPRAKPRGCRDRFVSCRIVLTIARAHAGEICLAAPFRRRSYPRPRRLYPHPPPPSKNNTKRTINMVSMFHLSFFSGSRGTTPSKSPLASPSLSIL